MFYEETVVAEHLKCKRCYIKFDDPRILPCGKTVCQSCIQEILESENKNDNSFTCSMCQKSHIIPEDGFPINELIEALLKNQPVEVYRSAMVESLKLNLTAIEVKTTHFENQLTNR